MTCMSFIYRLWNRIGRANLGMVSAAVAFYGFLSIFPAIVFVITIWKLAADPAVIRQEMLLLQDLMPPDAFSLLSGQVEGLLSAHGSSLGWAGGVSLIVTLWSARAGVSGLISGLNAVYEQPEHGSLHGIAKSLLLTILLMITTFVALMAAVVVPLILAFFPKLGFATFFMLEAGNNLLAFGLAMFGLAMTFRFGPNLPKDRQPRFFSLGLWVGVVLWLLASRGFVVYLANFNNYNKIYGSIGTVVVLLMWLYLSAYAILLGAVVDAERAALKKAP